MLGAKQGDRSVLHVAFFSRLFSRLFSLALWECDDKRVLAIFSRNQL